ncbi:neurotracting/lsamp/neurotrimin/obcam related cell adhesion molecule [Schistosoma mansoni]|uniref:neurotracting/lsamp/neurotrimin/obcam related cell adhesion molecule n=1 Tax=Schistosoma mansoni TaxID=6183 RepID=UPI00022DC88E|nr:neurotracting/lsamp/neurotrimin/obcam related cell adhesion molecule [Schistosoma mansoni]|eukprot:XP_018648841.1 neurotracting/lsamp/neurotrimin/obcam related cell adhesion molecule [Schistosoma mansoni]
MNAKFRMSLTEVKQNVYETNMNISVKNGSMAELSCPIDIVLTRKELETLTWIRAPRQLLTKGVFRVTENPRVFLAPMDLLKTKALSLYLRPTLPDDEGEYKCTLILKDRIHVHTVSLNISIPPIIIKSPVPYLKVDEAINHHNGTLIIGKLHRKMNQRFLCIAANGVQPDDQREVFLSVRFSPEVKMTNRIIKQGIGMNTVLTCQVSAHPPGSIRWLFNHHYPIAATSCDVMTNSEKKYCLQEHRPQSYNSLSEITSKLAIFNLKVGDFGDYVCSVSTIMGESFGVTTLQRFKTERFDTDLAQIMHQKQIERLSDKQVTRDRISNSHDNYYNKYLKHIRLSENKVYQRPIDTQNTAANATFTVQLYIKLLMVFNMLTVISHFLYF